MREKLIKLEIPVLLPEIQDESDSCLDLLIESLQTHRGITKVHIDQSKSPVQICLHFDPNIITLGAVQRIARKLGGDITKQYRHEQIMFSGMDSADSGTSLKHILENIPGMVHAQVNYAAGLIFVAYDPTILNQTTIYGSIQKLGYTLIPEGGGQEPLPEEHDHGSAPAFLPHWVQERWVLLTVIFAGITLLFGWVSETYLGLPANVSLIFFLISYIAGGYDIATHALPGLFRGQFDTDVLMISAAIGAAILGEWAEGAFLLFLFSVGHAGEHYALDRARNAINELGSLMPKTAKVKKGKQVIETNVDLLSIGDVIIVSPGDRVPVDGNILSGESAIDQSSITGESVPVNKKKGDAVFAGTINQGSSLEVAVAKLAKDNTLNKVMQLVAEAQSQQSPTQQFTQRFTAWFVPAILILVILVIATPPIFGWMPLTQSFYRGMLLLVAASPCALAIGTPASVLAGIAQAARNGVLIKGGVHLENLGSVEVMAFDKTGTLTEGRFIVTDIIPFDGNSKENILRIAGAVEQQSNHPLAASIVKHARDEGINFPMVNGLENLSGLGIRSEVNGQEVLIGSLKLFNKISNQAIPPEVVHNVEKLESSGKTTIIISQNNKYLGILALADTPRPNIKETLGKLIDVGMKNIFMLTGDNENVARQIGNELGITDIRAGLLPEDKLKVINEIKEEYTKVAMVGDGINDAPALAAASVGIAMGGAGTAVALETADIALMADDLSKLPFAVSLSRASKRIIRQNLWISLGIIGFLLVTSVFGWIGLSWSVVLHEGSSILVVLNALRLLGFRQSS